MYTLNCICPGDLNCLESIDCDGWVGLNPNLDPLWNPDFENFLRSLAQGPECPGGF